MSVPAAEEAPEPAWARVSATPPPNDGVSPSCITVPAAAHARHTVPKCVWCLSPYMLRRGPPHSPAHCGLPGGCPLRWGAAAPPDPCPALGSPPSLSPPAPTLLSRQIRKASSAAPSLAPAHTGRGLDTPGRPLPGMVTPSGPQNRKAAGDPVQTGGRGQAPSRPAPHAVCRHRQPAGCSPHPGSSPGVSGSHDWPPAVTEEDTESAGPGVGKCHPQFASTTHHLCGSKQSPPPRHPLTPPSGPECHHLKKMRGLDCEQIPKSQGCWGKLAGGPSAGPTLNPGCWSESLMAGSRVPLADDPLETEEVSLKPRGSSAAEPADRGHSQPSQGHGVGVNRRPQPRPSPRGLQQLTHRRSEPA